MSTRTSTIAAAFLLLTLLVPSRGNAGGRRRVLSVSPSSASRLSLTFPGTAGIADAGTMVSAGGRRAATSTRTVTLRIGEPSSESRGSATLLAFVETPDPRAVVRIDGMTLTAAPRVIRRHAPIGIAFTHRLEIEVPVTAAEGPLQTTIGWEVTTD